MPFNVGPAELMIIMAIALVVFGPKKLPEIGRGIGSALREFNKARNDFMDSLNTEVDRDEPATSSTAASSLPDSVPAGKQLEYPEPLDTESADALPYGGDFYAAEGDSQPSFRTGYTSQGPEPEAAPVAAASSPAPAGASATGEAEAVGAGIVAEERA